MRQKLNSPQSDVQHASDTQDCTTRNHTATSPILQRHTLQNPLQRYTLQNPLQRYALGAIQRDAGDSAGNSAALHRTAGAGLRGSSGSLPHLDTIQRSFGSHDVTSVQAHTGSAAARANKAMGSEAYATGNHVAFKSLSPSLHTTAHEAAHIVQQRAGVSLKGGVGQVGDKYEQHADGVADRVVQGKSAQTLLDTFAGGAESVQRKEEQPVQMGPAQDTQDTAVDTPDDPGTLAYLGGQADTLDNCKKAGLSIPDGGKWFDVPGGIEKLHTYWMGLARSTYEGLDKDVKGKLSRIPVECIQAVTYYTTMAAYPMNAILRGQLRSRRWNIIGDMVQKSTKGLLMLPEGTSNTLQAYKAPGEGGGSGKEEKILDSGKDKDKDGVAYSKVFRNDDFKAHFIPIFKRDFYKGSVLFEPAFFSTTIIKDSYGANFPIKRTISDLKGASRSISDLSTYAAEKEALFPPGCSFKINKIMCTTKGTGATKFSSKTEVSKPADEFPELGEDNPRAINQTGILWEIDCTVESVPASVTDIKSVAPQAT